MVTGELDERGTRRIIALLLSLAHLAERAASRSLPVRWLVLVLLRRAEAAALPLAVEAAGIDPAGFVDRDAGFRPVDAMLLAVSLRTIAAVLSAGLPSFIAEGPDCALRDRIGRGDCSPLIHPAHAIPFALPQASWDTS